MPPHPSPALPVIARGALATAAAALAACLAALGGAASVSATPLQYDCGPAHSAVWPGCTRLTPADLAAPAAASAPAPLSAAGWLRREGLSAHTRLHREPVANASRGTTEPPPIWTNAITQDAILGTAPNTLLLPAAPGEYDLFLLCGTSDPAHRNQYFDFTVQVGPHARRVQIEGCYQFRPVRFHVTHPGGPLALVFTPRSKWVLNAVLAWTAADAEAVHREVLTPLAEATWRLPPDEWARWQLEPEPASGPAPACTPAERARGFRVWSRAPFAPVYPHTAPRSDELDPTLRVFAPAGERTVTNVIVTPLADLVGARLTVSALGPIPASAVEVRRVRYGRARPNYTTLHRYRIVPDILERVPGAGGAAGETATGPSVAGRPAAGRAAVAAPGTRDAATPFRADDATGFFPEAATAIDAAVAAPGLALPAEENTRFWLTLHVPAGTPAGHYAGHVTFATAAGATATVPLQVRVLPLQLEDDPSKSFAIYYRHPYDQAARAPDAVSRDYFRRKAELEHADLVAHGTRAVVLSCWSRPADAQGNFSFDWELLAAKFDLWRRHGFVGPAVMGIPTEGVYEKHVHARYGSHLRGVQVPPPAFAAEITALVRTIEAERQRRGWPEFLYYPVDEPSTDPTAVRFMATVLAAVQAAGVRTYVTADPTHDAFAPLRPHVDVWCTQPFAPTREEVLADGRAEYWCYPNHINGENDHTPTAGARMTYGFGFWRAGFRALIPWIYQSSTGDPYNYLDGATMDFFNRSEPDGTPLPVALWEAYREGWTDYRYLYTLERRLDAARRDPRPSVRAAAEQAAATRATVWEAIRVQPKYQHDDLWPAAAFDVYRWLIAEQILALDAALRR